MPNDITAIWTSFHKELRGFILNKTRNPADADDILQDVFVKILRNKNKVDRAKNLRPYLYAMVRNAIYDHFRNERPASDISDIQEPLTEEESRSLNETIADCCVRPFINKLPEPYRDALLITEFENVSQKELAERLHISYSGAKSRVQRGKEKLKELILQCCAFQSDKYGNLSGVGNSHCECT